ncbi:MAG: glycosyltransferase [Bacteroidetes bacterium]|nr:glycosyltransferase [Bacteroidota bacterium]
MTTPLFSIITINYNNHVGLEKTIASVAGQSYTNYEFIIIDGGSTDDFSNLIKSNENHISYWCSEKDKGIYDAQNKGIAKAKGDFLIFMNSGDCFTNAKVLDNAAQFINSNSGYKIYYGNTNLVEEDGLRRFLAPPEELDINFFFFATLNHQSCFIHRSLFEKYGNYNLEYKIGADYEFFLKVFLNESQCYLYMNELICDYENYGTSANTKFFDLIVKERAQIHQTLLSNEQLKRRERLEIQMLGGKSSVFKKVPNSDRLKSLYDRFYYRWYKFITK